MFCFHKFSILKIRESALLLLSLLLSFQALGDLEKGEKPEICNETLKVIEARNSPEGAINPWPQDMESPLRWGRYSEAQLQKLRSLRVAVAGVGAIGGAFAKLASMLEIGHYKLADNDVFELHNRSRQILADHDSYGFEKTKITEQEIKKVHPFADVKTYGEGITESNIDDFLSEVDIVIDGMDIFAMKTRRMIFNKAIARGIPIVTVGPLGLSIASAYFAPGGMNFDQYFDVDDTTEQDELLFRFLYGIAPKVLHRNDFIKEDMRLWEGKATADPRTIMVAVAELANWIDFIFLNDNSSDMKPIPYSRQIRIKTWEKRETRLLWGLHSPLQKLKMKFIRPIFFNIR